MGLLLSPVWYRKALSAMTCNEGVFLCLLTNASLQPQLVLSQVSYRFRKG